MSKPLVHQFVIDSFHLVLDVNSGTLHAINELCSKLIDRLAPPLDPEPDPALYSELSSYHPELIKEAYGELYELWRKNLLWADWDDSIAIDYETLPVKSLCLHVAHDCNMHCEYCFASSGNYHGKRELMSEETAISAMEFLFRESRGRHNLEVDFFGGEPLLNFDVVKKTVEYARKREKELNKNVRFTLTTNALGLTHEISDYLNEQMYNLVFSLDGRREVHESMRHANAGGETYDRILDNIRYCVEHRGDKSWYVRGTFTHKNLDFHNDVLALAEAGLKHVSIEPVVLPDTDPLAIKERDLHKLHLEYERLARELIRRRKNARKSPPGMDFEFFHFSIDLNGGPCAYKRLKGCGSGTEYLAVAPSGDLYPCHQFVGKEEFKLGTVTRGIVNPQVKARFCRSPLRENDDCKTCFAKFFCSGGCAANNYNTNQDLSKPYKIGCDLMRKRLECAMLIKACEAFEQE